jgi:hypothetical protein
LIIGDATVPSTKSAIFVAESLKDRIFILRINETSSESTASIDSDYEPGSYDNRTTNYQKNGDNTLATLFYHLPNDWIYSTIRDISNLLRRANAGTLLTPIDSSTYITDEMAQDIADQLGISPDEVYEINWSNLPGAPSGPSLGTSDFRGIFKSSLDTQSVFYAQFESIYSAVDSSFQDYDFFEIAQISPSDSLYNISDLYKKQFSNIVAMSLLNKLYLTISEWPRISWDQYHEDGVPYSLNWEMITKNLGEVNVSELLTRSPSVIDANESSEVINNLSGTQSTYR